MNNNYLNLRFLILINLIKKRKINLLKIINFVNNYIKFFLGSKKSGVTPSVLNLELWNECNEACKFCRTLDGDIYDLRDPDQNKLEKGKLDKEIAINSLEKFKERLILAIPYINGEPLIAKTLYEVLSFCKKNKIATLLATNGIKLDLNSSIKLLNCDLDVLKVHISGMTNEVHKIEHRTGDVDKILKNIKVFQKLNKKRRVIFVLDYILYPHNKHQLRMAKNFCRENQIILNIRPGNTFKLDEDSFQKVDYIPNKRCDWIYLTTAINWNGDVLPCCDFVTWSKPYTYGKISDSQNIEDIWNGELAQEMRNAHKMNGRKSIDTCKNCPKMGIRFKF